MSLKDLTLNELKIRCKGLNLSFCNIKNKSLLIQRLEEQNGSLSLSEKSILEDNPEIYKTILPYVGVIPDFRPPETIEKMGGRKETWLMKWDVIYHELSALEYNERDKEFVETVLSNENNAIISYLSDNDLIYDFGVSYPALLWFLTKVAPSNLIKPIKMAFGVYLNEILPLPPNMKNAAEILDYIRDWKTALYMKKNYVDKLSEENSSSLKQILVSFITEPLVQFEFFSYKEETPKPDPLKGIGAAYILSLTDPLIVRDLILSATAKNKLLVLQVLLSYPDLLNVLTRRDYGHYINDIKRGSPDLALILLRGIPLDENDRLDLFNYFMKNEPHEHILMEFVYLIDGEMALVLAIKYGYVDIVEEILQRPNVSLGLLYERINIVFDNLTDYKESYIDIIRLLYKDVRFDEKISNALFLLWMEKDRIPLLIILMESPNLNLTPIYEELVDAIVNSLNGPEILRVLLYKDFFDPSLHNNLFLRHSLTYDPHDYHDSPYLRISKEHNRDTLCYLLLRDKRINPRIENDLPFKSALTNNLLLTLNYLLDRVEIDMKREDIMENIFENMAKINDHTFNIILSHPVFDVSYQRYRIIESSKDMTENQLNSLLNHSRFDPTFDDSYLLRYLFHQVIDKKRWDLVRHISLVLQDGRVDLTVHNYEILEKTISRKLHPLLTLLLDNLQFESEELNDKLLELSMGGDEITRSIINQYVNRENI